MAGAVTHSLRGQKDEPAPLVHRHAMHLRNHTEC